MPEPRDHRRDAAILRRLVNGDPQALADLYDAHAARPFRHGLALTGRRADAEDLVQTVFLKCATTGAPLLAVRNAPGYLHRIPMAAWIDVRKRPATSFEQPADMATPRAVAGTAVAQERLEANSARAVAMAAREAGLTPGETADLVAQAIEAEGLRR